MALVVVPVDVAPVAVDPEAPVVVDDDAVYMLFGTLVHVALVPEAGEVWLTGR